MIFNLLLISIEKVIKIIKIKFRQKNCIQNINRKMKCNL